MLNGNPAVLTSDIKLGHLWPQILPGHQLWCYTTKPNRSERFLTVENFDVLHAPAMNEVWLNLYLNKNDLDRLGMTEATALSRADLASDFEIVIGGSRFDWVCIQQGIPTRYVTDPGEALPEIVVHMRNKIWETVRITSPYRKPYVYRCPANERRARLPQMLAVYLFMYFLSSVTRYSPGYYEHLLESDYGPLVSTFISESPTQFLYLMASDILGREVSKPAIF